MKIVDQLALTPEAAALHWGVRKMAKPLQTSVLHSGLTLSASGG
jgi:hypothetical protein